MTREELIKALYEIPSGDPERDHGMADDLLLKYINDAEIEIAFESIPKWYA